MTRDECTWLIVRAVGAFILLLIALDLINVVLTSIQAVMVHNEVMSDSVDQDNVVSLAIRYGRLIERIWLLGIEVLIKAFFAYYCFFRGAWIQRLLTSRLPSPKQS